MKHLVPPIPHCLARLLALFILALTAPNLLAYQYANVDGVSYQLDTENFTAALQYVSDLCVNSELKIPETIVYQEQAYNVTSVADRAFLSYDAGVKSLQLPNSLSILQRNAFKECPNLETLIIGDLEKEAYGSVEICSIGVFATCPNLKRIVLARPIILKEVDINYGDIGSFRTNSVTEIVIGKNMSVWLNSQNKYIPFDFNRLCSLYSYSELPAGFLESATSLKSLTVPSLGINRDNGFFNLGALFYDAYSGYNTGRGTIIQYFEDGKSRKYPIPSTLEELTILEGCGMIPYGGLSNCNMLKKLTLPSTIYMVGEKALYGCAQLSDIYCMGAEPAVAYDNSFDGMRLTSCKLHVPYNSGDMYKEAEGWKRFRYIQEEAPIVISVTKNIENAGVVFGLEEYRAGQTAELRAVANSGYTFEGWYEGEMLLTAEGTYAFTVLGNRELVAVFAPVADSNPVSVDAPGETATFMWPAVEGAASYVVTAYSDEAMAVPVVTVSLDASGNPVESRADGDMSATLSGLSKETRYYYSISAFNANGGTLSRYTGAFTTGTAAIGEVSGDAASPVPAAYYNSQGIRSSVPWRGLNVVIYTDGSRRKLLID